MSSLNGKVAVITGAAGGIGAATARALASRGAAVVCADIELTQCEQLAAQLRDAGHQAAAVRVDLAEEASIKAMIELAVRTFGALHILDNNAALQGGGTFAADLDIETLDVAAWDQAFRINARGTMLCCRHAIAPLLAAGGGSIINISSNLGLQGHLIQSCYAATKAAIIQLTRSIATSHGKRGIRCNSISPGLVLSPGAVAAIPAPLREIVESETLTPYLGAPEDVASAVAFLASDEARYINGHNLVVDGGTSVHVPGFAAIRALFEKSGS